MDCVCLKTVKFVSKRSLALDTGTVNSSQSPDDETGFA